MVLGLCCVLPLGRRKQVDGGRRERRDQRFEVVLDQLGELLVLAEGRLDEADTLQDLLVLHDGVELRRQPRNDLSRSAQHSIALRKVARCVVDCGFVRRTFHFLRRVDFWVRRGGGGGDGVVTRI